MKISPVMEHNTGAYLAGVIANRNPKPYKYGGKFRVRSHDGVFDVQYAGYDPKYNNHLYNLQNIKTGAWHYETPEGYIDKRCEMITATHPCE